MMNRLAQFIFIMCFFLCYACDDAVELEYVTPLSYMPVYPGSYWDYTDGSRVKVATQYQEHQYEEGTNTTAWSPIKMVPVLDGEYVYEYSIYQFSTVYPLKQMLSESVTSWEVDKINNQIIWRKVISVSDTLLVNFADSTSVDSLKNVIVVVEYMDSLGVGRWNEKEYYAKNIGLVRKEVNNPYDTIDPVIIKEIFRYSINK